LSFLFPANDVPAVPTNSTAGTIVVNGSTRRKGSPSASVKRPMRWRSKRGFDEKSYREKLDAINASERFADEEE
jgi:hypothetical protein